MGAVEGVSFKICGSITDGFLSSGGVTTFSHKSELERSEATRGVDKETCTVSGEGDRREQEAP